MKNSWRSNRANHLFAIAFCLQSLKFLLDVIKHMRTKLQMHIGILNFHNEKQLEVKSGESSAYNCFLSSKSEIFVGCYQTHENKTTNTRRNFTFSMKNNCKRLNHLKEMNRLFSVSKV